MERFPNGEDPYPIRIYGTHMFLLFRSIIINIKFQLVKVVGEL